MISWKNMWLAPEYKIYAKQVERMNARSMNFFAVCGTILLLAKTLLNLWRDGLDMAIPLNMAGALWIFLYYLFIKYKRKDRPVTPLTLYLMILPVYIDTYITGVFIHNYVPAFAFFFTAFLYLLFITDIPLRLFEIQTVSILIFLISCVCVKDPYIYRSDIFHAGEYFVIATSALLAVSDIKRANLRAIGEEKKVADTDEVTGLYNRHAFSERSLKLLCQDIIVVCAAINYYRSIIDVYGEHKGTEIVAHFAETLKAAFETEEIYTSHNGSATIFLPSGTDVEGLAARCNALLKNEANPKAFHMTASFGYVTGNAPSLEDLDAMVHQARLYARSLQDPDVMNGNAIVRGDVFDEAQLRHYISTLPHKSDASELDRTTGLFKFTYFLDRCEMILLNEVNHDLIPVLLYVDIEHFKSFNRKYGYTAGDELLRATAKILTETFPDRVIGHVSGDHFVVMCYENEAESGAENISRKAAAAVGKNVRIRIGCAVYASKKRVVGTCDEAKEASDSIRGKDILFKRFDAKLVERREYTEYLVKNLDRAVSEGWLRPYYQPIVVAKTGKVVCMEALARLTDPSLGFLSPGKFIPELEAARQTHKIDLGVLTGVLRDMKMAEAQGVMDFPAPTVSVN